MSELLGYNVKFVDLRVRWRRRCHQLCQRSKHIDIHYHFIRDEVKAGIVNLLYVLMKENSPDIFTELVS